MSDEEQLKELLEQNQSDEDQEDNTLTQFRKKIQTDPKFKDSFNKHADENGTIKLEEADQLAFLWAKELGLKGDENLKQHFNRDGPLPIEDLRDELDYNKFLEIFNVWLTDTLGGEQKKANEDYWFDDVQPGQDHQQSQDDEPINTEQSDVRDQRIHSNIIKMIFEIQEDHTKQMFQQYAQQTESKSQDPLIYVSDFPLLLKNLLYEQNVSLYEKQGQEDFFMRENTYKNLEAFLKQLSDQEGDEIQKISYEEFKSAAIQFIQNNPDLIVMDHDTVETRKKKEKLQAKNLSLEEDLLKQIEKYQQILSKTESEIEKQVIRNMISTLVKQIDVIKEATIIQEQTSLMNQSQNTQKKQLQVSFSNVARPSKKPPTKEEMAHQNMEKQINEIFLFFCRQQFVNGTQYDFDRHNKEAQTLSIGMFIYFCQCFNLVGEKTRIPYETNKLEKKRRGIVDPPKKVDDQKKTDQKKEDEENKNEENKNEAEEEKQKNEGKEEEAKKEDGNKEEGKMDPKKPIVEKIQNLPRKEGKMSKIPSKFRWWNDDLKFDQFYKPLADTHIPSRPNDHIFLTRDKIVTLFKKSAFGKDLDYDEFKCLIGLMAQKMFFDPENPEKRHPRAYQRMLEMLYIGYPEEYRKMLKPQKLAFNCKEKDGFRELPGNEKKEYRLTQMSEEQKEKLKSFQEQRQSYLKEKLSEIKSNPNQSVMSIGSLGNISISKNAPPPGEKSKFLANYKEAQNKNHHAKVDLNREKVSWDKLEHVSFNELAGPQNFKPTDLLDNIEDDEDKFFLQEFVLEEEKSQNRKNSVDMKKDFENYGNVKESIRPTQKFMMNNPQISKPPMPPGLAYGSVSQSQPNLNANNRYQVDHSNQQQQLEQYQPQYRSPQSYNQHSQSLKNQYLQRAQQIQQQENQREQQLMQSIENKNINKSYKQKSQGYKVF